MNYLISSQLDADRIDYLVRDSHYTGVNFGMIDTHMIARRAMYVNDKIVFSSKATYIIENFLISRYHMYMQVYHDKHAMLFGWIIKSIFNRIKTLYKQGYNFVNKHHLLELFNS